MPLETGFDIVVAANWEGWTAAVSIVGLEDADYY
jgi:hypothetical protein